MEPRPTPNAAQGGSRKRLLPTMAYVLAIIFAVLFAVGIGLAALYLYRSHTEKSRIFVAVAAVAGLGGVLMALYFASALRDIDRALCARENPEDDARIPEKTHTARDLIKRMHALIDRSQKEVSFQLLEKQAQMDALQSQIQPHFLYNALDSIRGLAVEEGATRTADMTEALAVLYRSSIGKVDDLLTLEQEIKSIDNYVKIQQYRFGNRFMLEKLIDGGVTPSMLQKYKLPKLTLQPIVENAIYHGIDSLAQGGVIKLGVYTTQNRLVIWVEDNGQGMDDHALQQLNEKLVQESPAQRVNEGSRHSGIALVNVNARIKMLFGGRYGLVVYSTPTVGTMVEVSLPLLEG